MLVGVTVGVVIVGVIVADGVTAMVGVDVLVTFGGSIVNVADAAQKSGWPVGSVLHAMGFHARDINGRPGTAGDLIFQFIVFSTEFPTFELT